MTTLNFQLKRLAVVITLALMLGISVRWALAQPIGEAASPRPASPPIVTAPLTETAAYTAYLPFISRGEVTMTEFRGLWVTRFDWTFFGRPVTTTDLDAIVDNAASAHFNALLFQIRGTGDAFYSSTLEPWASRLSGQTTRTLGVDPGWDPLAYMITRAHGSGLQLHAYMNVYPTWLCDSLGPTKTAVLHPFWQWTYQSDIFAWREWQNGNPPLPMNLIPASQGGRCSIDGYLWASPASPIVQSHILSVAVDLATRYDLDGLHLDLVRYSSSNYSSDPATMQAFTDALAISPTLVFTTWRPQFQRDQVSGLVARIYSATTAIKPKLLLSAAVWPNYSDGYNGFFQASKDWLAGSYMDANLPMLYTSDILNDLPKWITRTQGFIDDAQGRWIMPGISGAYTETTPLFDRIAAARSLGAPGVAIFSYSGLNAGNFWDDLANGPFAIPAMVPKPNWRP
ncbi:MAG: family 10 glycosylhydrolase [Chloroflexi bacterium]|nr:family 10 glycosylhydrolase [Chloroflexota bacterium]